MSWHDILLDVLALNKTYVGNNICNNECPLKALHVFMPVHSDQFLALSGEILFYWF
jgi:hypothetical protein